MVEIFAYESKYHREFKELNLEWLEKFNLTESHDLEILDDPEGVVIAKGGCIFLAMEDGKVVGTAGLYKENEKEYELVKMAVIPQYRRTGVGKLLLEKCLEEARTRKGEKVFLYSNSQLQEALRLYEKYGFREVDTLDVRYITADVKMELAI